MRVMCGLSQKCCREICEMLILFSEVGVAVQT
jgi:hypothetical protein